MVCYRKLCSYMGEESPIKSIAKTTVTNMGGFLDHGLFQAWNMLSITLTSVKDVSGIAQANLVS